jgi:lipoate-protein ligase A
MDLLLPTHPGEAFDGPMQMALDEVLLREALLHEVSKPMLRIYHWESPWVTFGYFQKIEEVHASFPGILAVRRWTGGGMVSHGEDLTFSLIIPSGEKVASESPTVLYKALHGRLGEWIKSHLPVSVDFAGVGDVKTGPSCFQAPANDDLLIHGRKVLGGALRRSGGGLLYQGSLSISDIPGWDPLQISPQGLAEAFGDAPEIKELGAPILMDARELVRTRYGTKEWNHRK